MRYIIQVTKIKMEKKKKNRSRRYNINRPMFRHGHKIVNIKSISL